ncbi:MAG: ATP-binding protein [bacterium]
MTIRLAIASGKGGTGKTTVATNLSVALADSGRDVTYVDCDVEEPNGHLFLNPNIERTIEVEVLFPRIDLTRCTFCGECAKICESHALAVVSDNVLVFPELCSSCGACYHLCPEKAIVEVPKKVGTVSLGSSNGVKFAGGELDLGVARVPAVTRASKARAPAAEITIIDAPPGTSCAAVEAISDSDYVLLVTEPTPFGLNDLKLAVEMVRAMGIAFGVVINRADVGDSQVLDYCHSESVTDLWIIPEDRRIAELYSKGELLLSEIEGLEATLIGLFKSVEGRIGNA